MTKLVFYFLIRNKVKYEIIIPIFLGINTFLQSPPSQYGISYSVTLLSILYILYFNVLVRQKGRINLLYKGNEAKQLKHDIIKAISILSLGLFVIVALVDLFLLNIIHLTLYHIITVIIFIISALLVSINVEKSNDNRNQIISFKEGFEIVCVGIAYLIIAAIVLQFII